MYCMIDCTLTLTFHLPSLPEWQSVFVLRRSQHELGTVVVHDPSIFIFNIVRPKRLWTKPSQITSQIIILYTYTASALYCQRVTPREPSKAHAVSRHSKQHTVHVPCCSVLPIQYHSRFFLV